jgi:hypothetical protein
VHYVTKSRSASISSVQRKLRIGYNRAARLIEAMEAILPLGDRLPRIVRSSSLPMARCGITT